MESTETGLRWEGSDDEWEDEEGSDNADDGEETFGSDADDIVMSDEDYYDSSEDKMLKQLQKKRGLIP